MCTAFSLSLSLQVTGQAIYSTATYAPPARTNLSQLAPLSSAATSQPGSNTGSADGDHNEDEDEEGGGEGEDEDDESEDGESSEGGDDEDGDDEEEKDGETGGPNATTINDDDDDQNDPGVSGHPDSDNDGDSVDPGIGFHRRQVRRANSVAVAATYANSGTDHGRGRGENGSLHHNGGTVRLTAIEVGNHAMNRLCNCRGMKKKDRPKFRVLSVP